LFTLTHTDGAARRGVLQTAHGAIETPVFMPVGTQGAVKALTTQHLDEIGASIILGNTYHLMLRPGDDLIARRGGLHKFIGWNKPILTDSGGYQVFSLADRRKINENGVEFRSHLDGTTYLLTPERAVDIQANLGSDITMALDECPALPSTPELIERSVELTVRWAKRCRDRHLAKMNGPDPIQFGIIQGGTYPGLRRKSAELTVSIGFEGYAIGGLSVGEPNETMYEVVAQTTAYLPASQPRYLMGVGTPLDIVEAVARGVDMFDCVLPTRNARNGQAFTSEGTVTIKQARWAREQAPLDPACGCYTCRRFSRAYLRHLFVAEELLAYRLLTLHNVHFYLGLMEAMREAIAARAFAAFRARFYARYAVSSVDVSLDDPQRSEA